MKKMYVVILSTMILSLINNCINAQNISNTSYFKNVMDKTLRPVVLMDKFVVPHNAVKEFIKHTNYGMNFIKQIPGFVQQSAFSKTDEQGNLVYVTVAVWQNAIVLANAKKLTQIEYHKIGFNPQEMVKRLKIVMERDIYEKVDN